jgi:hypothetical protein
MQKAAKNAVHEQHKIFEYQMGWSFCSHFIVVVSGSICVFIPRGASPQGQFYLI